MATQRKPIVKVLGTRGSYKVFVKDRYGTAPFSGFARKTKADAEREAKKAKRWVKY